jgi:hypothetical protein
MSARVGRLERKPQSERKEAQRKPLDSKEKERQVEGVERKRLDQLFISERAGTSIS